MLFGESYTYVLCILYIQFIHEAYKLNELTFFVQN